MYYYNPAFSFYQTGPRQRRCFENLSNICFTWEDVNVDLKAFFSRKINKIIVKNQYGKVDGGQLVALLGSSGSGKTTLLNALSFRKVPNLKMSGKMKLNGVELNREKMLAISSFVQQEDVFIGSLKVREHLMFHATLRMGKSMQHGEKEAKVEKVVHEFMLGKCCDSLIGIPGRLKGISGGEKKRLSLATEILNDPLILFCDEPTSGLDSAMAYSVVDSLKKIAKSGKIVITTIHQPSSQAFIIFDHIYVLYDGFLGLAGTTDEVMHFLGTLNMQAPKDINPAEYILEMMSLKVNTYQADLIRANMITQSYQQSHGYRMFRQQIDQISESETDVQSDFVQTKIKSKNIARESVLKETFQIFKRCFLNFARDRSLIAMRFVQTIIYSLFVGIVFLQLKLDLVESVNINKVLFLQAISVCLVSSLATITFYPHEFPILFKENESRVYRLISYFLGNILFEVPFHLALTLIFCSINYWLIGLNSSASSFFVNLSWLCIASQVAVAYGHFLATFTPTANAAAFAFVPGIMSVALMTTFFLAGTGSPLGFLKHISWIHHTLQLLLINQWSSLKSTPNCPNCGATFLSALDVNDSPMYVYIIGLTCSFFVWTILAYLITLLRLKVFFR